MIKAQAVVTLHRVALTSALALALAEGVQVPIWLLGLHGWLLQSLQPKGPKEDTLELWRWHPEMVLLLLPRLRPRHTPWHLDPFLLQPVVVVVVVVVVVDVVGHRVP